MPTAYAARTARKRSTAAQAAMISTGRALHRAERAGNAAEIAQARQARQIAQGEWDAAGHEVTAAARGARQHIIALTKDLDDSQQDLDTAPTAEERAWWTDYQARITREIEDTRTALQALQG